jgi:hypothetical protein
MRSGRLVALAALLGLAAACADSSNPLSPPEDQAGQPNFALTSAAGTNATFRIWSKLAPNKCLDVKGSNTANGTEVLLWPCHGRANQQFTWRSNGELRVMDKCVDATRGTDGTGLVINSCNGAASQKWTATAAGELRGVNGKCIDVAGWNTADGAPLVMWQCKASLNQQWDATLVSGSPSPSPSPDPTPNPSGDFRAVVAGVRPRGFGQGTYRLVSPASGGRTYYVATTGNDSNAGSSSAPFRTINRAAQVANAGDVVIIRNGTYNESVIVRNSGAQGRPIVFQAESRGGVVLSGGNNVFRPASWSGGRADTGQLYVTLRGLTFRRYSPNVEGVDGANYPAAVKAARGWTIEDCLFDDPGNTGVQIRGSYVTITKSTFQDAGLYAMEAWAHSGAQRVTDGSYTPLDGIRITDVIMRRNHRLSNLGRKGDGVAKFLTTRGTLVDNVESYDNKGPGFWFDSQNSNYTIQNSYFHNNKNFAYDEGAGLFIEINWAGGRIENNVFVNNQSYGINVANTQGLTIRQNMFVGNGRCVQMVNVDRGRISGGAPMFPLRDITMTNNQCKGWTNFSAVHSIGQLASPSSLNIKLDGNRYHAGSVARLAWYDGVGGANTITEMRSRFGWEQNGSTGTINWP